MKVSLAFAAAAASAALIASSASAAVVFDPETGDGFVGKGDVQEAFGWNNKQLQDNADAVQFKVESTVVTEVSWVCTNSNNEQAQPRARTTTTSVEGLVESVARERKQVTGFNLTGYEGEAEESSSTDGPALNSCPGGPWTLTTPAGDPELVESSGGGMQVSTDGVNWIPLESGDPVE
jgi:opacity protein-like surface antigen